MVSDHCNQQSQNSNNLNFVHAGVCVRFAVSHWQNWQKPTSDYLSCWVVSREGHQARGLPLRCGSAESWPHVPRGDGTPVQSASLWRDPTRSCSRGKCSLVGKRAVTTHARLETASEMTMKWLSIFNASAVLHLLAFFFFQSLHVRCWENGGIFCLDTCKCLMAPEKAKLEKPWKADLLSLWFCIDGDGGTLTCFATRTAIKLSSASCSVISFANLSVWKSTD